MLANGLNYPANYPVTAETYPSVDDLLRAVARGEEMGGYTPEEATAWVRAYYGAHTVKKVVTALGEGVAGIMLGNTEDWFYDEGAPSVRDATVYLIGGAAMMGMIDVHHDAGYDLCDERTPGDTRPAWENLRLLSEHLGDFRFDSVERVGATEGARGYRLERGGVPQWVLWSEDGALHLPGEAGEVPITYTLDLPVGTGHVVVSAVYTDSADPAPETLPASAEQVTLTLTSTPVFVEIVD